MYKYGSCLFLPPPSTKFTCQSPNTRCDGPRCGLWVVIRHRWGHGWDPHGPVMGSVSLWKEDQRRELSVHPPSDDTARRQHRQAGESALPRSWIGTPAPRAVRINVCCLSPQAVIFCCNSPRWSRQKDFENQGDVLFHFCQYYGRNLRDPPAGSSATRTVSAGPASADLSWQPTLRSRPECHSPPVFSGTCTRNRPFSHFHH